MQEVWGLKEGDLVRAELGEDSQTMVSVQQFLQK